LSNAPVNPSESAPRKRILLVDDDEGLSEVLIRILKNFGFNASSVHDPLQASKVARELRPDLVILDFDMPKLTGPEVAIQLRGIPELAQVPIIFLSGLADQDHRTIATFSGAVAYLDKPTDEQELIRTVRGLI
jgi:DNA-binding response OmpR family regulator